MLVCFVLILIAGSGVYYFRKMNETIVHPTRGPITEVVYGLGKVKSHRHYDFVVGVLQNVEKLFVEEGQSVEKGAPLIQLQDQIITRSPLSGTVTLVKVKAGETALPQMPIVRVEDLHDCFIELSLEQESALRVRNGMKAKVSFESIRNKVLQGEVFAIFPREDEFLIQVKVPELDPGVLPGMTADVAIEVGHTREALMIPARAVSNGLIQVKRKGKWKNEKIEIGVLDGVHVEILSPELKISDEVRVRKE